MAQMMRVHYLPRVAGAAFASLLLFLLPSIAARRVVVCYNGDPWDYSQNTDLYDLEDGTEVSAARLTST